MQPATHALLRKRRKQGAWVEDRSSRSAAQAPGSASQAQARRPGGEARIERALEALVEGDGLARANRMKRSPRRRSNVEAAISLNEPVIEIPTSANTAQSLLPQYHRSYHQPVARQILRQNQSLTIYPPNREKIVSRPQKTAASLQLPKHRGIRDFSGRRRVPAERPRPNISACRGPGRKWHFRGKNRGPTRNPNQAMVSPAGSYSPRRTLHAPSPQSASRGG